MCYKQTESDYLKSAMLEKSRFESKLLMESSAVIKKLFEEIATKKPDYLVVTGDLSSDGERVALIEIANALRSLQNKIRDDGKNNFQIFPKYFVICIKQQDKTIGINTLSIKSRHVQFYS